MNLKKNNKYIYTQLALCIFLLSCLEAIDKNSVYVLNNKGGQVNIKVMTFNILSSLDIGSTALGYPVWGRRKQAQFGFIQKVDADVIGLQELTISQFDQYYNNFSDKYTFIENKGFSPEAILLYKTDKFKLLEKGYWNLTKAFDFKTRRITVWAKLKHLESSREMMFISTHLDARSSIKGKQAKAQMKKLEPELSANAPLFSLGDFNITPEHSSYKDLTSGEWKDSFILNSEQNTFPALSLSRRIDHIFYYGIDVNVKSWSTKKFDNDIILSDHLPVIVEFEINARK